MARIPNRNYYSYTVSIFNMGTSIDFITHEVLSKFIPFLKRKEYPLTPAIKNAINKMYIQLRYNRLSSNFPKTKMVYKFIYYLKIIRFEYSLSIS